MTSNDEYNNPYTFSLFLQSRLVVEAIAVPWQVIEHVHLLELAPVEKPIFHGLSYRLKNTFQIKLVVCDQTIFVADTLYSFTYFVSKSVSNKQ